MRHVFIQRLTLTDFRNYPRLRLDVEAGPVVLTGSNGAGKTNLLEAISFLAPGRGLRGAKLRDVGRQAYPGGPCAPAWGVAAGVNGPDGLNEIGTGLTAAAPERRAVQINVEPARGGVLREGVACDRCNVAIVTILGGGDHLGLNYSTTLEDL